MSTKILRCWGVGSTMCGILAGCTPCASGFSRSTDGVCFADEQCPDGFYRDETLSCVAASVESTDERPPPSVNADTGSEVIIEDTGGVDEAVDAPPEGYGRIFVRYPSLSDLPMHGFFVMGQPLGEYRPSSAFCQVILAQEVDVDGVMTVFDGVSQDCPLQGDAMLYPNGEVQLFMQVAAGATAEPVLCDERVVQVDGDTAVDFGDVIDCVR